MAMEIDRPNTIPPSSRPALITSTKTAAKVIPAETRMAPTSVGSSFGVWRNSKSFIAFVMSAFMAKWWTPPSQMRLPSLAVKLPKSAVLRF